MAMINVYERLRVAFDTGPGIRMPRTDEAMAILRECYTPEETEIVSHLEALWLGMITGVPTIKSVQEVAQETRKDPQYVTTILEDCFRKGTVGKGMVDGKEGYYHMQALTIEDTSFCDGRLDAAARRLGKL